MGTHPIFESDFDCLTDKMGDYFIPEKKVKEDTEQPAEPSFIISKVLDLAQATTHKNPQELQTAFEAIQRKLNELREDIKKTPALQSLKETQEIEHSVLEEQLGMKSALIERYKSSNLTTKVMNHLNADEMN